MVKLKNNKVLKYTHYKKNYNNNKMRYLKIQKILTNN